eukprot:RCo020611
MLPSRQQWLVLLAAASATVGALQVARVLWLSGPSRGSAARKPPPATPSPSKKGGAVGASAAEPAEYDDDDSDGGDTDDGAYDVHESFSEEESGEVTRPHGLCTIAPASRAPPPPPPPNPSPKPPTP